MAKLEADTEHIEANIETSLKSIRIAEDVSQEEENRSEKPNEGAPSCKFDSDVIEFHPGGRSTPSESNCGTLSLENCMDERLLLSRKDTVGGNAMYKRIRVPVGKDANGKTIYRQVSGNTEEERFEKALQMCAKSGLITMNDDAPVVQKELSTKMKPLHPFNACIWDWYVKFKEPVASEKYKATLNGKIKRLCGYFHNKELSELTVSDVQEFLNSLSTLTKGTVNGYRKVLADFFGMAMEDGWMKTNPASSKKLRNPGQKVKSRIKAYDQETARDIHEKLWELSSDQGRLLVALMFYAGLRREEALGLEWADVDFEKKTIYIKQAVVYTSTKPILKEPKTDGSERVIPVCDDLLAILETSRQDEGFVLNDQGKLYSDYKLRKLYKTVRKELGIEKLDARALRHTYATVNAFSNVEPRTLAGLMGHSDIKTTMNIYAQSDAERMKAIRNVMSDAMNKEL